MPQQTPWITKTFTEAQTRFEIAIHFPQGSRRIKAKGDGAGSSSDVNIAFAVQLCYLTDDPQVEENWKTLSPVTVTGIYKNGWTKKAVYKGTVAASVVYTDVNAAYDKTRPFSVRIRRTTQQVTPENEPNEPDYRYYYTSVLSSITGFKENTKPVTDPPGVELAKTAVSIMATKQLNGQVEAINAMVETYCLDWNPPSSSYPNGAWLMANTNNPASLFLYVLTHPGNPQQIKTQEIASKINLEKLQYWHQYCATTRTTYHKIGEVLVPYTYSFKYNNVVSNVRSVLEVLRDICAAGRASPALIDGKWSVNIDEAKSITQHFTPHNSWGFESTKALPRIPDGLKVRFYNEDLDFKEDEIIVYNYGYGEKNEVVNDQNIKAATLFESITLPGVTNIWQAKDHGKWHFAQIKLRPEIYTLNTDVEYLVCNRGDRVKVTHDVPMWGRGSGRIKNRLKNGVVNNATNQTVSCLELDEEIFVSADDAHTIRIRSATGTSFATSVINVYNGVSYSYVGSTVTVNLASPDHPLQVGDVIIVSIASIINTTATITSITGAQIKYTKPGLIDSLGTTSTTGFIRRNSGRYSKIKLDTEVTYQQAAPLDLFMFGLLNKEAADLIVLSVEPTSGAKNARLTLVDYGVTPEGITPSYNIFTDYKNITSAPYQTLITGVTPEAEVSLGAYTPIISVDTISSSTKAMEQIAPGVFSYGILIPFTNPLGLPDSAQYVEAEYVLTTLSDLVGETTIPVLAQKGSVLIKDVERFQTYAIRLRYVTSGGITGMWSSWVSHRVTGKFEGPENPTNFTYTKKETGLQFSWDPCITSDYSYSIVKVISSTTVPTDLQAAWKDPLAEKIFQGKSNGWSWIQPLDGTYQVLVKHIDVNGNGSITPALLTIEYDGITIAGITVELTNDNHQIPTDSAGDNANLTASGTDIYVYHGATKLTYDTIGTTNGTWKIVSAVSSDVVTGTGTDVIPGQIQPLSNPSGDDYATIADLQAIAVEPDMASIIFTISGTDLSGNTFNLTKQQKFVKQKNGENLVLYRINSSTPVVYKNTPDNTTPGDFSRILVEGRRYEGQGVSELFGWLGITPYINNTAGTEAYVYQSIDTIPLNTDQSTRWIIKLYGVDPEITPPGVGNPALDTEEISVVFEGEVYTVEIESSNGTIFRPGLNSSTILIARVFKNGIEVTANLPSSVFRWRRVSSIPQPAPNDDTTWNTNHLSGYKQISVNVDDVYARATFFCEILTS